MHVLTGLAAGADWNVRFLAFSLGQVHVAEGAPSVWQKPEQDTGIIALQAGVVVRDDFPELFPAVHRALFAARHDDALHLEDANVVRDVLKRHDVPVDQVFARIDDGSALATVRAEHEGFAESHDVWGVPTSIVDDQAVFIRFMHRLDRPQRVQAHRRAALVSGYSCATAEVRGAASQMPPARVAAP